MKSSNSYSGVPYNSVYSVRMLLLQPSNSKIPSEKLVEPAVTAQSITLFCVYSHLFQCFECVVFSPNLLDVYCLYQRSDLCSPVADVADSFYGISQCAYKVRVQIRLITTNSYTR